MRNLPCAGSSTTTDACGRDKVKMTDGTCQRLLMQGNCITDEVVLLHPETNLVSSKHHTPFRSSHVYFLFNIVCSQF